MHKNQKGFHLVVVLVAVVVLGVVGFAAWNISKERTKDSGSNVSEGSGPNYKALSACGSEPMLTRSPIDLSKLDQIGPLGAINPPEHTIPTDHMYFMYRYERPDNERYDLVAPGDIVVTSINYSGKVAANGQYEDTDYAVTFWPCKGVSFKLGHVNTLEGPLKGIVGADGEGADCRRDKPTDGNELLFCTKDVDIKVSAGDVMGKLGAKYVAALDVGAYKLGTKDRGFTSPKYYHGVDAVCPLDFFTKDVQTKMYALIRRTGEPRCGQIGQDKANTLQGTWYSMEDPEQAKVDWNSHLTLAHTSDDPSEGVLAIAGKIADPASYFFTPTHEGAINREPSETTAGTVYCYQHDGDRRRSNGSFAGEGKTLLKLTDNHTMQAEHKSGSCSNGESFSSPTTYYR